MPKGTPLTEEELDRRRHEIFNAAAKLIVDKGFNETSMRQIAEAAGVGKSTLYDYFPSKDEILMAFVIDEVQHVTEGAREIMSMDLSPREKFSRILHKQLDFILTNKQIYPRLSFEMQRLSFESQQQIQLHRHIYQDMLSNLIEEGIQKGEFRPVNALLVVRGIFSMLFTTVFTTRPSGTAEEMLQETLDIIFKGLNA